MKEKLIGTVMNPEKIHGKSAYEIAVMHGFDGTEKEWLESLGQYEESAKSQATKAAEHADRAEKAAEAVESYAKELETTVENETLNVSIIATVENETVMF